MAENPREVNKPVEQDTVYLFERPVVAVRLPDGRVAAVFTDLCRALELDRASQARRVRTDEVIGAELLLADVTPADVGDGDMAPQPADVLTAWAVPVWLQGIQLGRLTPEKRPAILAFKREAANVLYEHFSRRGLAALPAPVSAVAVLPELPAAGALTTPAAQGEAAQLVAQIGELTGVVNLLREHLAGLLGLPAQVEGLAAQVSDAIMMLDALGQRQDTAEGQLAQIAERTQRLTPAHARAVQEEIGRMVRATAHLPPGSPAQLTYPILYGRLKQRFRAGSYAEIADERFDAVMAFLHDELRRATSGEAPEQGSMF